MGSGSQTSTAVVGPGDKESNQGQWASGAAGQAGIAHRKSILSSIILFYSRSQNFFLFKLA